MNPEIASIRQRLSRGDDQSELREEISRLLQEKARTQEEHVALLEAHRNLMAVAESRLLPDEREQFRQTGKSEYLYFLNVEAMEGGQVNPVLLERITAREVESGRMDPDDPFRKFAKAGGLVLGDSASRRYNQDPGDWIQVGSLALGALVFFSTSKTLGFMLFVVGTSLGWFVNKKRQKLAILHAQRNRELRGYD